MWAKGNSADPDQTPQSAASDKDIHWFVTKFKEKWKLNTSQHPFKRKWTGPIDKKGKFHSA